jgi:hypothetical protein
MQFHSCSRNIFTWNFTTSLKMVSGFLPKGMWDTGVGYIASSSQTVESLLFDEFLLPMSSYFYPQQCKHLTPLVCIVVHTFDMQTNNIGQSAEKVACWESYCRLVPPHHCHIISWCIQKLWKVYYSQIKNCFTLVATALHLKFYFKMVSWFLPKGMWDTGVSCIATSSQTVGSLLFYEFLLPMSNYFYSLQCKHLASLVCMVVRTFDMQTNSIGQTTQKVACWKSYCGLVPPQHCHIVNWCI